MIHVLLVDDHPSVGEGTKKMLEQNEQMKVTFVKSAREAIECIDDHSYDVMLCDLNMPGMNGIELSKLIMHRNPESKIIIYSGYELSAQYNLLIESGVCGFISKTATRDQLQDAIRCALRDEAIIPISLLKQLRRKEVSIQSRSKYNHNQKVSINEKELLILKEIASGVSNKELACKFYMSQRGIEYQITKLFDKLNVRTRTEAIKEAIRLDLIPDERIMREG